MSTVTIPDDLIAKLRAVEGDKQGDVSDLVARALRKYASLSAEERRGMVERARARGEALRRAGISEEEVLADFDEWRHRQGSGR